MVDRQPDSTGCFDRLFEIARNQYALFQYDVQIAVRPIFQVLHGRQSKLVRVLDKIVQRGRHAGSRQFFDRPLAGYAIQNAGDYEIGRASCRERV